MKTSDGRVDRFAWERVVRDARLGTTDTAVALTLATFARRGGAGIFPGERRLYEGIGVSRSTVARSLARLREAGLIVKVRESAAYSNHADEYRLSLPGSDSPTTAQGVIGDGHSESSDGALCVAGAAASSQVLNTQEPITQEPIIQDVWALAAMTDAAPSFDD